MSSSQWKKILPALILSLTATACGTQAGNTDSAAQSLFSGRSTSISATIEGMPTVQVSFNGASADDIKQLLNHPEMKTSQGQFTAIQSFSSVDNTTSMGLSSGTNSQFDFGLNQKAIIAQIMANPQLLSLAIKVMTNPQLMKLAGAILARQPASTPVGNLLGVLVKAGIPVPNIGPAGQKVILSILSNPDIIKNLSKVIAGSNFIKPASELLAVLHKSGLLNKLLGQVAGQSKSALGAAQTAGSAAVSKIPVMISVLGQKFNLDLQQISQLVNLSGVKNRAASSAIQVITKIFEKLSSKKAATGDTPEVVYNPTPAASTCNRTKLNECLAYDGGNACYPKWGCPAPTPLF